MDEILYLYDEEEVNFLNILRIPFKEQIYSNKQVMFVKFVEDFSKINIRY